MLLSKKIVEYIDSIAVPVSDKLMYDIAKTSAHGDDELAKIVQEALLKQENLELYLTNVVLPMKLTLNILQEIH
jgi:chaperonin GroEL (HSP60 family)